MIAQKRRAAPPAPCNKLVSGERRRDSLWRRLVGFISDERAAQTLTSSCDSRRFNVSAMPSLLLRVWRAAHSAAAALASAASCALG